MVIKIIAGVHAWENLNERNRQIRSIIERIEHPAYQRFTKFDVSFCDAAILKVDEPFIFNAFVKKVDLPPFDYDPPGKYNKVIFNYICHVNYGFY